MLSDGRGHPLPPAQKASLPLPPATPREAEEASEPGSPPQGQESAGACPGLTPKDRRATSVPPGDAALGAGGGLGTVWTASPTQQPSPRPLSLPTKGTYLRGGQEKSSPAPPQKRALKISTPAPHSGIY